jgi:hypothetical protein
MGNVTANVQQPDYCRWLGCLHETTEIDVFVSLGYIQFE